MKCYRLHICNTTTVSWCWAVCA